MVNGFHPYAGARAKWELEGENTKNWIRDEWNEKRELRGRNEGHKREEQWNEINETILCTYMMCHNVFHIYMKLYIYIYICISVCMIFKNV